MPFQDFREFLDALRNAGELLELDRLVSPELEVGKGDAEECISVRSRAHIQE
jgi:3-polyprenyl-4-hydroxybenzoate decarboxylase